MNRETNAELSKPQQLYPWHLQHLHLRKKDLHGIPSKGDTDSTDTDSNKYYYL